MKYLDREDFISDLKLILKAKDFVIDLIWNNPKLALESEKNIYQLLKSCFYNNSDLNILVGHDTNIATVLGVLDIEVPELNQLEKYPIGSKLIFSVLWWQVIWPRIRLILIIKT